MSDPGTGKPLICVKCGKEIELSGSYIIYDEGTVHIGCSQIKPDPSAIEITRLRSRIAELEGENAALVHDNANLLTSLTDNCTARVIAEAEVAKLREACRIALLNAPIIRLAPERRFTIKTLEAALAPVPRLAKTDTAKGRS